MRLYYSEEMPTLLRTCFVLDFQAETIIKTAYLTLTITGQYRYQKIKIERR